MRYLRIVAAFSGAYWAMQEHKWNEIRAFLRFKAAGGVMTEDEIQAAIGAKVDRRESKGTAVAVVPVYGIVSQRISMMDDISGSGSASTERIMRDLRSAMSDPAVSAVILDVDSPGGTVSGVPELAKEIYGMRGQKPLVAIANSLAASAAYWIASAASEFHVTPSGEAGSIGVFAEHTDMSKWLENEGIKPTLIQAGEFKTEGNQYAPLTDQAAAYIQSRVDDYYGMFIKAVAKHRGVTEAKVRNDFGKGRVFGAEQAVGCGMADKVSTFDQVLRKLGGPASSGKSAQVQGIDPEIAAEGPLIQISAAAEPEDILCGPVKPHSTGTSDDAWDGPANEKKLPSPMSVATARSAYAWIDDSAVKDDQVNKADCKFIHHEVSADGKPGKANMTACSSGIGVLNGGRGGTTIPKGDRQGVHDHLAKHLKDGGKDAPPLAVADPLELERLRNEFEL